jgi:hypothetical protein
MLHRKQKFKERKQAQHGDEEEWAGIASRYREELVPSLWLVLAGQWTQ